MGDTFRVKNFEDLCEIGIFRGWESGDYVRGTRVGQPCRFDDLRYSGFCCLEGDLLVIVIKPIQIQEEVRVTDGDGVLVG